MKLKIIIAAICISFSPYLLGNGFLNKCFLVSVKDDPIKVINVDTNVIVDAISGSGGDAGSLLMTISNNGSIGYVTNNIAGTVSVINITASTVTDTIIVDSFPWGIVTTAESISTATVYVANAGSNNINVISAADKIITSTITDASFAAPRGLTITPDNETLYVVNSNNNSIAIVDITDNNTVVGTVTDTNHLLDFPSTMVLVPGGTKAYVTGVSGVVIVDTATNKVTGKVTDPYNLTTISGIAFTPDGLTAYATALDENKVAIINVATDTVTGLVDDSAFNFDGPLGIAVAYPGQKAYITNQQPPYNVSILNTETNTITGVITGGQESYGIVFRLGSQAPIANNSVTYTQSGQSVAVTLSGYADKVVPLTFTITDEPQFGTLGSITQTGYFTAQVTYTPNDPTFAGFDGFTFSVNDGVYDSYLPGSVSVVVSSPDSFVNRLIEKYDAPI